MIEQIPENQNDILGWVPYKPALGEKKRNQLRNLTEPSPELCSYWIIQASLAKIMSSELSDKEQAHWGSFFCRFLQATKVAWTSLYFLVIYQKYIFLISRGVQVLIRANLIPIRIPIMHPFVPSCPGLLDSNWDDYLVNIIFRLITSFLEVRRTESAATSQENPEYARVSFDGMVQKFILTWTRLSSTCLKYALVPWSYQFCIELKLAHHLQKTFEIFSAFEFRNQFSATGYAVSVASMAVLPMVAARLAASALAASPAAASCSPLIEVFTSLGGVGMSTAYTVAVASFNGLVFGTLLYSQNWPSKDTLSRTHRR